MGDHALCKKHSFACRRAINDSWLKKSTHIGHDFKLPYSWEKENLLRACVSKWLGKLPNMVSGCQSRVEDPYWRSGHMIKAQKQMLFAQYSKFYCMIDKIGTEVALESRFQVKWSKVRVKLLIFILFISVVYSISYDPLLDDCQTSLLVDFKEKRIPIAFLVTKSRSAYWYLYQHRPLKNLWTMCLRITFIGAEGALDNE